MRIAPDLPFIASIFLFNELLTRDASVSRYTGLMKSILMS